jgi:hypothetical protein
LEVGEWVSRGFETVKGSEGFVITSFMTSKKEKIIKKGVIWRKQQTS